MLTVRLRANVAQQTPFQAIQSGPCPVTNAHSAPPHWPMPMEIRCVLGAILVFTATTHNLVNALPANSVASKTSRAKPRVLNAQSAKLQMKCALIVKTHLGALAKLAKNTCMTWDLETNGRAKRALQAPCATQIPVGPPCKSRKAIGSSLGTQNKPHPLPNARFPLATLQTMGPIVPPVPSVWSVAFATPIFIAPQRARVTLARPLPPRHEWGLWSL